MMDNNYSKKLLQVASSLDAITGANGQITKLADSVVNHCDDESVIQLYKKIVDVIDSSALKKEIYSVAVSAREAMISYLGYSQLVNICTAEKDRLDCESGKPLEELLNELNSLVGLHDVKATVNDLIVYQQVRKLREMQGLHSQKETMHLAFTGNPGTGKTTVARIIGHVYKQLGLLSKGHFIEVSRTDLIAGYQGQTALKVKKVVEQAKGGVLFIDEAYSLTENDHSDSYGRECLTELTKALEDYRDDLVVIVAGYTEPMQKFFDSNPGLKSRFNTFIEFNDFTGEELSQILISLCKKNDYLLNDSAAKELCEMLYHAAENAGEQFANGRFVRNVFDELVMNHARRVIKIENVSKSQLMEITTEDIPHSVGILCEDNSCKEDCNI